MSYTKFFKAEKSGKTHFAAARRHTPQTNAASGVKFSKNNFLQAHNSGTVRRSVTQQNIIFVQNLICNNFLLHTKSSKIKNEEVIGHILLFKAFYGYKITLSSVKTVKNKFFMFNF